MKKVLLMSLVASSVVLASGYKIPETSTNAVALSAANVAHTKSADAAYYNPANMVFMSDKNYIEVDLTYIGLDRVSYKGTYKDITATVNSTDESSQRESFYVPTLHYVSEKLGERARIGVSIVAPAGLSKRWQGTQGSKVSEEFTLQVVEVNPTVALKLSESVGMAFGFRVVHSSGVVKLAPVPTAVSQDMTGDSVDFGYNLALAYKPTKELEMGLTYRSKVNMSIDGSAILKSPSLGAYSGNSFDVSVDLPIPAVFSAAIAYTLPTKTTLEFVYEKTYWSAYKNLDFNYKNPLIEASRFGLAHQKDWKDTIAYRLGVTQELDSVTLMAGIVLDETPVPEKTISFELPDSDSLAVSLGGRYAINESIDIGLSGLYSMRDSRTVNNASLNGEFSDGNVLIISAGLGYKF